MTAPTTQSIEALTEKEKQTLRLIVRGHDAKSIARSLNLSIHTVNDRLRDARRKLAVPSSREAARMLFDAEEDPPKTSGHTKIGEGSATPDVEENGGAWRMSRLRWIMIGGIAMSLLLGLIALTALPQLDAASHGGQPAAIETKDPAIVDTARRFLELGDQGNWTDTYRMTGPAFQKLNSAQVWADASVKARSPLGPVQSRVLVSEQNLPAPPRGYEVVKFRTSFANKADVVETVTLERADSAWQVVGVTLG
jgi:DNA-binding CsgD family transcriptional regulator